MPGRRLIILGSTGSIGINALEVVDHLKSELGTGRADRGVITEPRHDFEVIGLAAGGANFETLVRQAQQFGVRHVAIADASLAESLRGFDRVFSGPDAALHLIEAIAQPGDLVLGAMVGSAGIPAVIAAIDRGCDIALANKETLVAAGGIVMPLAHRRGVRILPVDSEHSAVFQCLACAGDAGVVTADHPRVASVRRIVLTASGGPFRTWSREQIRRATVDQALNHPTWSMGRKVTVDSASLMNKALEVIEAHWLFGLPSDKIDVVVHPQSIVHSFVEFVDGSVLAQLGPPDMKTPIQAAMTWPDRIEGCSRRMDWSALRGLEFEPVDHDRFPAIRLAREAVRRGDTAGATLNAANEAAVAAFLDGRIPFTEIGECVAAALQGLSVNAMTTIDDVMKADRAARSFVNDRLAAMCRSSRHECAATGARTTLRA
jgi:1-deoxy-D-xylulose-5-phosphate reductoisomerase